MIRLENVNKSLDFYKGVLGFKILQTVPDSGDYVFAHINRDSVNLMLQKYDSSGTEIPYFKNKEIGFINYIIHSIFLIRHNRRYIHYEVN